MEVKTRRKKRTKINGENFKMKHFALKILMKTFRIQLSSDCMFVVLHLKWKSYVMRCTYMIGRI